MTPAGALVLLVVDSSVIHTSMGAWFLLYPSLVFCFAVMLPIGFLTNWLKKNWRFDVALREEEAAGGLEGSEEGGKGGSGAGPRLKMA